MFVCQPLCGVVVVGVVDEVVADVNDGDGRVGRFSSRGDANASTAEAAGVAGVVDVVVVVVVVDRAADVAFDLAPTSNAAALP